MAPLGPAERPTPFVYIPTLRPWLLVFHHPLAEDEPECARTSSDGNNNNMLICVILPVCLAAYPATALTSGASIVSPSLPPASFFRFPCSLLLSYQHHFRRSGTQRAATPLSRAEALYRERPCRAGPSRVETGRAYRDGLNWANRAGLAGQGKTFFFLANAICCGFSLLHSPAPLGLKLSSRAHGGCDVTRSSRLVPLPRVSLAAVWGCSPRR